MYYVYIVKSKIDGDLYLGSTKDLVNLPIDLSQYAKGIYYVQVVTDRDVITKKIIYH